MQGSCEGVNNFIHQNKTFYIATSNRNAYKNIDSNIQISNAESYAFKEVD